VINFVFRAATTGSDLLDDGTDYPAYEVEFSHDNGKSYATPRHPGVTIAIYGN
jgi:hypothetical protein